MCRIYVLLSFANSSSIMDEDQKRVINGNIALRRIRYLCIESIPK